MNRTTRSWTVMAVFGAIAAIASAAGIRLYGGIEREAAAAPRGAGVIATA
jgi:hypothetical protein